MITISKYSNTIEYQLKTTLDNGGISKLQAELKTVQNELSKMQSLEIISESSYKQAHDRIQALQNALKSSFNGKMNMLDMSAFSKQIKDNNISLGQLQSAFNMAGSTGQKAFNSTLGYLGKLDTTVKSVSKTTDKMWNTLGNTARWGVIASGFQEVMNSVHNATQYIQDLDKSLTEIMMVTDYSRDFMNDYAKSANEAAKAIGSTTVAMTDATTVFAQQGFDIDKSSQLATLSTKLAHASGQDTSTTSEQITAYMNAYGMDKDMNELSQALDAWAEVANVSAADVQELATASQKAASTANTVGVNMDQLAAQIATIESVTKDAPENIGKFVACYIFVVYRRGHF